MAKIDFDKHVDGYTDGAAKATYHREAKKRLRLLAKNLGLPAGTFDVRTNMAGPAVRGESVLHGERIYVMVGCMGGMLIRTCEGRKDYTGGPNHFANHNMLDQPDELASLVKRIMG